MPIFNTRKLAGYHWAEYTEQFRAAIRDIVREEDKAARAAELVAASHRRAACNHR